MAFSLRGNGWSRLDNAAKIFPANTTLRDAKVFRFSCQLKETIVPDILAEALEKTLLFFPHYRSVLRRGLFWHFLEKSDLPVIIEEENLPLCSPLYNGDKLSLLFRVSYYKKRINVEVHHSLSDGTGVLEFLRTLLYYYLLMAHAQELTGDIPLPDYDASFTQKLNDSFEHHYTADKNHITIPKAEKAYKIEGARLSEYRLRIIEGTMPLAPLKKLAKEYNTTLTVLLGAVLIEAINEDRPRHSTKLPIVLSIPVNLRNYFESQSARNFFGLFYAGYNFSKGSGEFHDIINTLNSCFKRELTAERLGSRMNDMAALERNVFTRIIPLFIKDITLRYFGSRSESQMTVAFSNLGKIHMPEPLNQYIEKFSVSSSTNKLQVCLASFGENLTVTTTAPFISADIEMRFFRKLANMGADVTICANETNMIPD